MRLPEPSPSSGGPFAAPVRSRDALSSVQSSNSFFRPSVDFTSIFKGNSVPNLSAPIASQPSKKTVQPWDDEEDEAVQVNDSATVQPLALAVDAPITSASPVIGADKQVATPKDSATATPATAGAADGSDSTRLAANEDASENVGQTTETRGERATLAKPVADIEKTSPEVAGGTGETFSPVSDQDRQTERLPSQITAETRVPIGHHDAASDAQLAAQTQNQNALTGNGQSTSANDGKNASNRNSARQGRGRSGGTAAQQGRAAQAEVAARTRNEAATTEADSAVGQAGAVDASLASGSTDATTITKPRAVELAPTPGETSVLEAPVVAGPVAAGSQPATGPLATGGQSSDLGAIGKTSNDDSGRSGDRSAARTDENLSRTDIADRARLIHRISKAFTKMGTDGGQIRMKMHPETLGGVLLEMRVRGRNVEATVTADNEAARGVLQQQLSELRQRLESQGMTVQRLEVALRDDSTTGGSLLQDHRGEMFGGDRGSGDNGQSRRPPGPGNTAKTSESSLNPGGGSQPGAGASARSLSPAAPGTLDLRL